MNYVLKLGGEACRLNYNSNVKFRPLCLIVELINYNKKSCFSVLSWNVAHERSRVLKLLLLLIISSISE